MQLNSKRADEDAVDAHTHEHLSHVLELSEHMQQWREEARARSARDGEEHANPSYQCTVVGIAHRGRACARARAAVSDTDRALEFGEKLTTSSSISAVVPILDLLHGLDTREKLLLCHRPIGRHARRPTNA